MSDPIQLEMIRALKSMRKKGSSTDTDTSDTDTDEDAPSKGGQAGFKDFHKVRQNVFKKPAKNIVRFRERTKRILKAHSDRQHWSYSERSLQLLPVFGKMKGLWRCHHALSELLTLQESGDTRQAIAFNIQLLKALHQVALDRGDWSSAALLIPSADPLAREAFGGEERELLEVHRYKKALRDLKEKHQTRDSHDDSDDDGTPKEKTAKQLKKEAWAAKKKKEKEEKDK